MSKYSVELVNTLAQKDVYATCLEIVLCVRYSMCIQFHSNGSQKLSALLRNWSHAVIDKKHFEIVKKRLRDLTINEIHEEIDGGWSANCIDNRVHDTDVLRHKRNHEVIIRNSF